MHRGAPQRGAWPAVKSMSFRPKRERPRFAFFTANLISPGSGFGYDWPSGRAAEQRPAHSEMERPNMKTLRFLCWLSLTFATVLALPGAVRSAEPVNGAKTALDEYVAKPDPAYEWK